MKVLRLVVLIACAITFTALSSSALIPATRVVHPATTNSPPVANDDTYTRHGVVLTIGPLLLNDSDPDGDPMNAQIVTFPTHGELSGLDGNSFSYNRTIGAIPAMTLLLTRRVIFPTPARARRR